MQINRHTTHCMEATPAGNPALHFLQPTMTHSYQSMVKPELILAQLREKAPSPPPPPPHTHNHCKDDVAFSFVLIHNQHSLGRFRAPKMQQRSACLHASNHHHHILSKLCMRRCLIMRECLQGGRTRADSGESAQRQPVHRPRLQPLLAADKSASGIFAAFQPDAPGTCKVMP